jgi:hypothetical protein
VKWENEVATKLIKIMDEPKTEVKEEKKDIEIVECPEVVIEAKGEDEIRKKVKTNDETKT